MLLDAAGVKKHNRGVKRALRTVSKCSRKADQHGLHIQYRQGLYTPADGKLRAMENYCSSSVAEME